ncbi:MAG: hypothetical protein ACK5PQ_00160 [Alphaproteobacteria bacterium]
MYIYLSFLLFVSSLYSSVASAASSTPAWQLDQLDFSQARPVISNASKFVIPVEVCPEEECDEFFVPGTDPQVPLTNYEKKPLEGKGIVFWNGKDKSWQGARADTLVDGGAVVVLNNVDGKMAQNILTHMAASLGLELEQLQGKVRTEKKLGLKVSQLKEILESIRIKFGLEDMYDTTVGYVSKNMQASAQWSGVPEYPLGLYVKNRDICQALYLAGSGSFQGPAGTPQVFSDGAVILKQDGQAARLIQRDVFLATYTPLDGSAFSGDSLEKYLK